MLTEMARSTYFYQCSGIESAEQIGDIGNFFKDKKKNSLLRICTGIYCDSQTLNDKASLRRIQKIFQSAQSYSYMVPILHYSFRFSRDPIKELEKLSIAAPYVKYIQLNDLSLNEIEVLRTACKFWRVDFPLNNDNFDLVNNKEFVKTVLCHKIIVLLDNSRGRGISESKSNYIEKIESLLEKGITRIALCGGFGLKNLEKYFEICNYYQIPFSIDAESNLRSEGKVDIQKIKKYFSELIKHDLLESKYDYLKKTATLLKKEEEITRPYQIKINGKPLVIYPQVFNPEIFFSSKWFAAQIAEMVNGEEDFLEIGCGTGIVSLAVAWQNKNISIIASDISKSAVNNTKENMALHRLQKRMSVYESDVFDGLPLRRKFDTIFWALPFGYVKPGTGLSAYESQVHDPGYRSIRKFFADALQFLKPSGRLLVGFSSDIGHLELLEKISRESGFVLKLKEKCKGIEKDEVSMEIWEARLE